MREYNGHPQFIPDIGADTPIDTGTWRAIHSPVEKGVDNGVDNFPKSAIVALFYHIA